MWDDTNRVVYLSPCSGFLKSPGLKRVFATPGQGEHRWSSAIGAPENERGERPERGEEQETGGGEGVRERL